MLACDSAISSVCVSTKDNRVYSASQDGTFKVWDIREERQLRSTQISDLALSSCCLHNNDAVVMLGSWDNNMYERVSVVVSFLPEVRGADWVVCWRTVMCIRSITVGWWIRRRPTTTPCRA